jgi:hypothetical protein
MNSIRRAGKLSANLLPRSSEFNQVFELPILRRRPIKPNVECAHRFAFSPSLRPNPSTNLRNSSGICQLVRSNDRPEGLEASRGQPDFLIRSHSAAIYPTITALKRPQTGPRQDVGTGSAQHRGTTLWKDGTEGSRESLMQAK